MASTAAAVAVATATSAAEIASSVSKSQVASSSSSRASELINDGVVATSSVVLIGSFFWVSSDCHALNLVCTDARR